MFAWHELSTPVASACCKASKRYGDFHGLSVDLLDKMIAKWAYVYSECQAQPSRFVHEICADSKCDTWPRPTVLNLDLRTVLSMLCQSVFPKPFSSALGFIMALLQTAKRNINLNGVVA
eukprot:g7275.t1